MKITSVYSNKYPIFSGKVVNFEDYLPQKTDHANFQQSPVDPQYYQALKIITPSNSFNMTDEEIRAFFDEKTINDCFVLNNKIDKTLVSKFILIYKDLIKKARETEANIIECANKTMTDFDYNPQEDSLLYIPITRQISERAMTVMQDGDCTMKNNIMKKLYCDIARTMIDSSKERLSGIEKEAFEKTKILFQLSRTSNGFDFSSVDEKLNFISKVYGMLESVRAGILDEYFTKIKDSKGNFDADLASKVFDISYEAGCRIPLEDIASILKEFIEKDPKNKKNITNVMFHIVQNMYSTESKESLFKLMNTCFDENQKYDKNREQILMELFQALEIWLETNYDENNSIYTDSDIKAFSNISISLILKYFKDAKNEGVDFESLDNPDFIPYNYINNELKNVKLGGCF